MTKKLTEQQDSGALTNVSIDEFGESPISGSDIMIPKVNVMQKMSRKLDECDDLKEGDLVDSMTDEKLGGIDSPLEFIPFYMEKVWFRSVKNGNEYDLLNIEDWNTTNENLRYSEVVDGREYKNELHMRFYILLPQDSTLPYVLTFKGMSLKKGKALATQMYIKNRAAKLSPASKVMKLTVSKEKNDKGSYCVITPSTARNSIQEEVTAAAEWFKTITGNRDQIKQSEMKAAKSAEPDKAYASDNNDF